MKYTNKYLAPIAAVTLLVSLIGCASTPHDNGVATTTTTTTTSDNGAATGTATTTPAPGSNAAVDDAALTNNVQTTLANTPGVNAGQINVQSNDGVVTLSGNVDSASAANAAVQAAQTVNGVTSVRNDLTVTQSPPR